METIVLLVVWFFSSSVLCKINYESLTEPLVREDGDFLIVGIFEIGILENDECILTSKSVYALEKALVFQDLMRNFTAVDNYTIGYEIYSGCDEPYLDQRISSKVALNEKVIGLLASDKKSGVLSSIGPPTSFFIPTIGYIYSEDAFLKKEQYPTYLSLLETEEMEAMTVINLLKFLNAQYVDIWYNPLSETAARYVYDNYVSQAGGGRFIELYGIGEGGIVDEFQEYDSYGEIPPAPIQLMLFNGNKYHVIPFLTETILNRKWRNKTYIFGYTISRDQFRPSQKEILTAGLNVDKEVFIYLRSEVQNADPAWMTIKGGLLYDRAEAADDRLSQDYHHSKRCDFSGPAESLNEACTNTRLPTSWMSFVATATLLLKNNVQTVLQSKSGDMDINALRSRVFETLESGTQQVEIYGQSLKDITFNKSTLAVGYQVLEYRNSSEVMRGRVLFHNEGGMDDTLKDHVKEIGGADACSEDCPPGSYTALMSYSPGLGKCWTCPRCTGDSVSSLVNANECTECKQTQHAVKQNTFCEEVPENFISLRSPQFLIGLCLSGVAGLITIFIAIFIAINRNRPVIKASDPVFCYLFLASLCVGDILTVLTLLEPSPTTCNLEFYCCSLFVCCVCTNLFYRSLKIYKIFMTAINFQLKRPFIFKFLTRPAQFVILVVMIGVTALLTMVSIMHEGWVYEEALDPHISIHKVCNSANFLATCYPFIVPCVMVAATLLIAYKMRLFPHNFKETTTIFTTSLVIVVICLMFLSGYSISEPSIKSLLRAIVYFSIAQCFLFCIFFPKLVVLLKKDDLIDAEGTLSNAIHSYIEADEKRQSVIDKETEKKRIESMEKESRKSVVVSSLVELTTPTHGL